MAERQTNTTGTGMQLAKFFVVVLVILSTVSFTSQWYAHQFSMPRYCAEPGRYIERVAEIIKDRDLLENDGRRQYLVAAKLNYLSPRHEAEPVDAYLRRLRTQLRDTCSQ